MIAITDAELAQARADLATMLPDSCTIQRKATVSDGGGGQTEDWADLATDVACRVAPASALGAGSTVVGDRLTPTTTHIVTLPAGQDVQAGDRIITGASTFEVLIVGDGGAWELARHVEARRAV